MGHACGCPQSTFISLFPADLGIPVPLWGGGRGMPGLRAGFWGVGVRGGDAGVWDGGAGVWAAVLSAPSPSPRSYQQQCQRCRLFGIV